MRTAEAPYRWRVSQEDGTIAVPALPLGRPRRLLIQVCCHPASPHSSGTHRSHEAVY